MSINTPPPPEHLTHPKYRPDIDGLRAIAVLSVVIFHAFPRYLRGGFIGVDIFFVISGFLISTIIMGSLERNSFSFVEFYSRRIKRIFPALILVLIASFVFGWFALLAGEYKQLGKHIAGGASFISNFLFWNESGYFDNAAETKPLLHLWSLGIEEQFYIVWPLLLWLAWKKRFNLLTITIVVAAISFALNVSKVHGNAVAAFYLPQTRFWELLVGSFLAYMTLHRRSLFPKFKHKLDMWLGQIIYAQASETNVKTLQNIQSVLGAVLILTGLFFITKDRNFPGWWALLPTFGSVLIISAGVHSWFNRVVLSNRVLVWFGLISFPLYLWHWPLLSFARIMESEMPPRQIRITAVMISIVLAWLTYKFIEQPIRFGKQDRIKTIILFLLMLAIGCTGYYSYKKDGFEFRHKKQEEIKANANFDWPESQGHNQECSRRMALAGIVTGYCDVKNIDHNPEILIIGDSHGDHLYPGVANAIADKSYNVMNLGAGPCLPFFNVAFIQEGYPNSCGAYIDPALKFAIENENVRVVILSSRGPLYLTGRGYHYDRGGEEGFDRTLVLTNRPEISDFRQVFKIAMKNTIERLLEKNKEIIFVLDVPELGFDPQSCIDFRPLRLTPIHVRFPCAVSRQDFDERNLEYRSLVFSVLKDFPTVHIFDAAAELCDEKLCWAMKGGKMLYQDDDHLSFQGSDFIGHKLVELILASIQEH